MEELIDIYDEDGLPTGVAVPRKGTFLHEGQFMLYVLAIVRDRQGDYLIIRRALDKRWAPGQWEVPGGGVHAGETSAQAVVREVHEEVGLDVSGPPLMPVFSYKNVDLERGDNYLVDIYHFETDATRQDVVLQQSEAIDCTFASWDDICTLAAQGEFLHFERIRSALESKNAGSGPALS